MNISIVGTGYVGLVTGACLADIGHRVTCVDIDAARVAALNAARSPIHEPGLDEMLARTVGGTLAATGDLDAAVLDSDLTFIAVGTPFDGASIDLSAVLEATRQIGNALKLKDSYHVVVVKSTVVPGTTDGRVAPLLESTSGKKVGIDIGIGMNPEFLSEGQAVHDFMNPDRIVLGAVDERAIAALERVYAPFTGTPRIRTNTRTAEMIKYAANALLATLVSFSNELANLGAALGGIDTREVMRGVHLSHYFTTQDAEGLPPITSFLQAGCGFGGSCLPKDVKALVSHGRAAGQNMALLDAVIKVNDDQHQRVVALLEKHWADLMGVRVAVLGMSFKPGTSDVRDSPAFPIVRSLVARSAAVSVYDPVAIDEARRVLADTPVDYRNSLDSALEDADAVVLVTPWDDFRCVPQRLRDCNPDAVFVDCRRVFEKSSTPRYEGIGL